MTYFFGKTLFPIKRKENYRIDEPKTLRTNSPAQYAEELSTLQD